MSKAVGEGPDGPAGQAMATRAPEFTIFQSNSVALSLQKH